MQVSTTNRQSHSKEGFRMRTIVLAFSFAAGVVLFTTPARAGCNDPDLVTVRDAILAACPCSGNHGLYVSCVARAVRDAVTSGQLDTNCKGKVVRCAARSTCGKKEGFVTCTRCVPGTCTGDVCDDGVTPCADSSTCPQVVDRCSTKSSAALCAARGGIAGSGSCCLATCEPAVAICGNNQVEPGELCDPPGSACPCSSGPDGTCSDDCTACLFCGS
jgi:hypothetical protein